MSFEQVTATTTPRAIFARMGRNVAWLLGGRGFVGLTSLIYLLIAARSLGPRDFGTFSLILAYGQLIATVVTFQSWQGVIRYGSLHLARRDGPALARLLGFSATLDFGSAIVGAVIALAGAGLVGELLGWAPSNERRAALFAIVVLLSVDATPQGILRLFDRFDLIAYCQAAAPSVRLAGALAISAFGGGVRDFLFVWGLALVLQSALLWITALGRAGHRLTLAPSSLGAALVENSGILGFMASTNFSSSLSAFGEQLGTLAVGATAGPAAAGGYRLASKLAKAVAKPIRLMGRVLYPEFARLVASQDTLVLRQVVARSTFVAVAMATLLLIVIGIAGDAVIGIMAGKAYRFAHLLLFLLAIAAAIQLSGLTLEPLLNAHGRAGLVLAARMAGAIAYVGMTLLLLPRLGAPAAAIAAIVMAIVVMMPLSFAAWRIVRG